MFLKNLFSVFLFACLFNLHIIPNPGAGVMPYRYDKKNGRSSIFNSP